MNRKYLSAFILIVIVSACSKDSPTAGTPDSGSHNSFEAKSINNILDLTLPESQQPQTDPALFDESILFTPNFAINQNDPSLANLFSPEGKSNLCFPAAFAESLVYLHSYNASKFSLLKLSGLSTDNKSIDPNLLVRQLATLCRTDSVNGTDSLNALNCTLSLFSQSGYDVGNTKLISPFNNDSQLPILNREVTIQDLRETLKERKPVLMEAAWFSFNVATNSWTRKGGHYISVFGYDYNRSWGENQIQLKVVNPDLVYNQNRKNSLFDTITVERYSPQPGITYPPNRSFILSGNGFGGSAKRGFLGMILVLSPTAQ